MSYPPDWSPRFGQSQESTTPAPPRRHPHQRQRQRRLRSVIIALLLVELAVFATKRSAAAVARKLIDGSDDQGQPVDIDPSEFSPGACVAYSPTSGDRHLTVFLDAGHGGIDPGAVGTTESGQTIYEADETLPIELDTMALLRQTGFRVVVSRTKQSSVVKLTPADESDGALSIQGAHDDVAARDICANDAGANVLVGIYFDAGASATNAGCVTGYDTVRPFAAENLKLANLVQQDVLSAMNAQGWAIPDEGVVTDNNLGSAISSQAISYGHLLLLGPAEAGYFNTPSQMPGALIEPLFITDPFEGSIAASHQGQQVIAGGLAEAVQQYFAPSPTTS
jgi:N-acetylmuramoyl-L-alanine amidase